MKYLALALLFTVVFAQDYKKCVFEIEGTNPDYPVKAKYDLRQWANLDYHVNDAQMGSNRNLTYHFHLCKEMTKFPTTKDINGNDVDCYGGLEENRFTAYQTDNNLGGGCYAVGRKAEDVEYSLIDQEDPTQGIYYTFLHGETMFCTNGKERTFRLILRCVGTIGKKPQEETVYENNCDYSVDLNAWVGCPSTCGYNTQGVCNLKGVCKFDPNTKESRCFCNAGYHGNACQERGDESAEGFTQATLVLLLVLIFLIVVECVIFLMWGKVKSLRLDPNAYGDLSAADELA